MPERVVKIEKAKAKGKKYTATVSDGTKTRKINFGAVGYGQFKDSTSVKAYSGNNHGDPKRRKAYFSRHSGVATKGAALKKERAKAGGKLNAKILAHKYLW